jgi:transcriptional regulator with XRE-family HTH domain
MDATGLRESLKALGMSQSELARRLGYTTDAVNRWCMGKVPVPQHVAEHLRVLLLAKEMLTP